MELSCSPSFDLYDMPQSPTPTFSPVSNFSTFSPTYSSSDNISSSDHSTSPLDLSPSYLPDDIDESSVTINLPFSSDLLYCGAPITTSKSWNAIMEFTIETSLTYRAVEKFIELLQLHCPKPNHLPNSFYKLKTFYEKQQQRITRKQYCSRCDNGVPLGNGKCIRRECQKSMAELSHLYVTDFEESLVQICEGRSIYECINYIHVL